MGLEYRGSRVSEDQDIIRLLDARQKAGEAISLNDAKDIINPMIGSLATKSYVNSAFSSYATQADVDAAYNDRVLRSSLGSVLLQLDEEGEIPPSLLPNMSTDGAVWVSSTTSGKHMDISGTYPIQLTSPLWVNASWVGNNPYHAMGFGQIEVKGNFYNSNPAVYISESSSSAFRSIGTGHGIPGWLDYYHVHISPTYSDTWSTTFNGGRYFYLTGKSFGGSTDFMPFSPRWGVLAIPVHQ